MVYRKKLYSLSGSYQENYNNNSIVITSYSSHARNYTGQASWSAKPWLSIDASYSKLHLDTVGGLAFFAAGSFITNEQSIYISNIHAASLGLRMPVTKRADLYLGYNITKIPAMAGHPTFSRAPARRRSYSIVSRPSR